MKKITLLFLSIISIQISKAQAPSWIWALSSSGGSFEYANGISVDTSGHFFIAGRLAGTMTFGSQSATGGGADNPYVGGFDTSGTCSWLKEYTYSGGYDYPWGFCRDKNDNVYSGGVVNSGGASPMFVEKYDKNGNLKWEKTVAGGGLAADGLAVDGAGCVYVVGAFQNFSSPTFGSTTLTYSGSYQAVFIAKMDSNGNWLWAKMADGTGANDGYDVARGIGIDQYANIYVAGGYYNMPTFGTITVPNQSANPYPSLYVAEYDSSGNAVNVTTATNAGFNNGDCCTLSHIVVDSCGYFYVTGYFQGTAQFGTFSLQSLGGEDVYVAKCSNSGVWQWANDIGGSGNDQGQAIALDKTSDVYAGGSYQNGSATLSGSGNWGDSTISGGSLFIAKYANSTGALQWVKSQNAGGGGVGGISVDNQNYMYVTGSYSGSNLAFGNTNLTATSNSNVFVAKLDTVAPRRIVPIIDTSYCPGSTATIPYTIAGTFNSGNVFTVQLSDSTGSFVDDTDIGSVTSDSNGTITIIIPSNTPAGSNYLIRIVSSNPPASSWANGCGAYYSSNVYPNDFYVTISGNQTITPIISPVDTSICPGASVTLTASGGTSYSWSNNDTGSVITVSPSKDTLLTVTAKSGCGTGSISDSIKVGQASPFSILPQDTAFCSGQSATFYVSGGGSGFIWTPTTGLIDSTLSGDSIVASPLATTTYTVTGINSSGCATSGVDIVTVIPSPGTPTFTQNGNILTSSSIHDNQWFRNDTLLNNDTSENLTINVSGYYWVVVTNEANGCSTASDSVYVKVTGINQLSAIGSQLSIYPNPFNGTIFIQINSSAQDVKDWNLQVTDMLGRMVYSKWSLDYNNDIDLSNLSSGVYFITVINKTGRAIFPVVRQN